MHTSINWSEPVNWVIGFILLLTLIGQIWLIVRNSSLSTTRRWLRGGLNVLLWLVVVGYFLQVRWPTVRSGNHALLVGNEVPAAFLRQVKDSLHIRDSFTTKNAKAVYDSMTLVGQDFPMETLTQLSNTNVQWVPYNEPDQLQTINWKGIMRQGEVQRVTGRIRSSEKQLLRLKYGSQTLDSATLHKGDNSFTLRFPAFTRGRSQAELMLGRAMLDTIRFFSYPATPLTIQFLMNGPDFESKTLADWLGKQGHRVQLSTTLSKNISSALTINKTAKSTNTVPDLVITEPANASNGVVRKAISDGRSVLFINLSNPDTDCRTINQGTGSRWQVRKISNDPTVPAGNGLTALPYRFAEALNQFAVSGFPVAVQRTAGRVGVSLLGETFPLSLSGDTVAYNRIWTAVMARLSGSEKNNVLVDAPAFSGLKDEISVNNVVNRSATMRVGRDTFPLDYSPFNKRSATGAFLSSQLGWQPVEDSLALYLTSAKGSSPTANRQIVSRFIQAHLSSQRIASPSDRQTIEKVPDWVWLTLFLVCFTALWVEPKIV